MAKKKNIITRCVPEKKDSSNRSQKANDQIATLLHDIKFCIEKIEAETSISVIIHCIRLHGVLICIARGCF